MIRPKSERDVPLYFKADFFLQSTSKWKEPRPETLLSFVLWSLTRRWISNPGVPCSKPLGGSKVDSAFHPSEVDKMSTRNYWELSGKK